MTNASMTMLAWLLTYAVHSTVLLIAARLITRRHVGAAARDVIWKTALVGGIITASAQMAFAIRPAGSVALASSVQPAASPSDRANADEISEPPAAPAVADRAASPPAPAASAAAPPVAESRSRWSIVDGVVLAWVIIGVGLALVYAARRLILVGRLGDRRAVTAGPLLPMLSDLQVDGRVRTVTLTSSNAISSPVALGFNEICIPEAALTELGSDEQRGLLAHELAHLERRDPLWLDAAMVIERLFFFQPLNRGARREMQLAAEHLCDDWAASRLGSGVPLAKCLAQVAEWIQASPLGVPVAGMAEQRSQLVERISRLVERNGVKRPMSRLLVTSGAIVLIAAVVAAAPGVQSRGKEPQRPEKPTATEQRRESTEKRERTVTTETLVTSEHALNQLVEGRGKGVEPDSSVVTALIERLKDTDARVRRAAAGSLGNLRSKRAVPGLVAALGDKDREVRATAAEALANLHDTRAINPLIELLHDDNSEVRKAAIEALGNFEHEEIPAGPVLPALSDANAEVRQHAARLLGTIGDRAAVGPLTNALHDSSPDVRVGAAEALGEIKDRSSAQALIALLHDENREARQAAVEALRELEAAIPEKALFDLLADPADDVRQQALEYVKDHRIANAAPLLMKLLDDPKSDIRVGALSALAEMRDPTALKALKDALKSPDPKVRARAAELLGERP